ncbi:MAG TPA: enoyl-CoA hydratase/isomerase family protein [Deltaproteobacteria bacterium]|nr:enoyl-CoA hydratase/isomerase family protein [Deltaproteobacteria bacterium]
MAKIDVEMKGKVAVVTMNDGENRFNPSFLDALLGALDQVEKETDANALVVTSSHEKIFCNGIDLEWLVPFVKKGDFGTAKDLFYSMNKLFRRLLLYPMPTIAAISGHSFAGGAIMCCAFDFRFMRSDRGYFCFPEVDLGIPFLPGMLALLKRAIPLYKVEELVYTGKRVTAQECMAHNMVVKACPMDELMEEALAFAAGLNKRREIVLELKTRMHKDVIHALDVEDPPVIDSGVFYV